MEYSPMMFVMLWALTPSDASGVAAHVEEVPQPGMTVHQESYFTFNHGKPFVAEQDPLTGAILNLKTTPVVQDDYVYDEEEEMEPVDRKDTKVYTRNDIIQPSKDPDLHKFLNLPVHYSTSGKFPLISSSYANLKVQGHNAGTLSNHRPEPTSSTTTVSPSYYTHKTSTASPTPMSTSRSTTLRTTMSSTTTTTTSTTTTTTPRPTTAKSSTTLRPPPPAYEYEYEYDYDREPQPAPSDHKSTTQSSSIFDFFGKDYEFLGASEEEKKTTRKEEPLPSTTSAPAKTTTKDKGGNEMLSSNSNLFIPSDYLKPSQTFQPKENKTETIKTENKTITVFASTPELYKPVTEKTLPPSEKHSTTEATTKVSSSSAKPQQEVTTKLTTIIPLAPSTQKEELLPSKPVKEQKVPFFPTVLPEDKEQPNNKKDEMKKDEGMQTASQKPSYSQNGKPASGIQGSTVKPLEFHHPYLKPQDVYALQNKPTGPYGTYQRPPYLSSDVPPEMQPPQRPQEPSYYPRPPPENYRPVDPTMSYRPQNNRPMDVTVNKPSPPTEHTRPPHHEVRPSTDSLGQGSDKVQNSNRPIENKPQDYKPKPETSGVSSGHQKPNLEGTQTRPTDPSQGSQQRPHEGHPYRPDLQQGRPVETHSRPYESPQKPSNRPTDSRFPTYGTIRPQEARPEQRPTVPEHHRPLQHPQRPEEMSPQGVKDISVGFGAKLPEANKKRPEPGASSNNNYQVQFSQPTKVENHFIKVQPGQENPSYSLQTSFSIGVPPPDEVKGSVSSVNNSGTKGVGQVLFPDEGEKRPSSPPVWGSQEKRPSPQVWGQDDKRPSPPVWGSEDKRPSPPVWGSEDKRPSPPVWGSEDKRPSPPVWGPDDKRPSPLWGMEDKRPSPPAWGTDDKRPPHTPWGLDEKRPGQPVVEGDKYPRPPWESHIKPPLVYNHLKKEPYPYKRPKPTRPDLPNILPQFRPNAKIGHAEPPVYLKTPYDTLRPPPLPRPQFLRAEPLSPEEESPVHRRNGQTSRISAAPVSGPVQPVAAPPQRGALRSEEEKTDPVFVVYPTNNAQDGVVVGTRGPQRPLPPDNLDIVEDSFPLHNNKNFQSRIDTPILKGKPTKPVTIKNEFPYPLVKPTDVADEKTTTTTTTTEKTSTEEYTAFSPTVSPAEKEHDTEINVIPYLQDYMPFATKKPSPESPVWSVGGDSKPISVTLKTQKTEETTTKIENHKTGDHPTPQDFQAPFHASLSAPSQGWSVVSPRTEAEKESETTTIKTPDEQDGKFDIQNFKPQLFGGFQPILPPVDEVGEDKTTNKKNEKESR